VLHILDVINIFSYLTLPRLLSAAAGSSPGSD
jgi:hypothetical protein